MERNDLVRFELTTRKSKVPVVSMTHPGTDMDEVLAMWLIDISATAEWISQHSQDGVIYLGVGEASQQGVFNEHSLRDLPGMTQEGVLGDESNSCATLVAKSLEVFDDPVLKPLILYGLAEDTAGSKSPFDLPTFLKHARKLGQDNSESIRWVHEGLDIWLANELAGSRLPEAQRAIFQMMSGSPLNIANLYTAARLLNSAQLPNADEWRNVALSVYAEAEQRKEAAAAWTKAHAQPHHIEFAGNRFTYYVIETPDEFGVEGFYSWSRAPMLVRLEPNGRFQIFMRGDSVLGSEVFSRLIHKITEKKNLIPDEVMKKSLTEQLRWVRYEQPIGSEPYWMSRLYFHQKMSIIFNGSLTAYYQQPLIGDCLTVTELLKLIELAVLKIRPRSGKPRPRPMPKRMSAPATPTPAAPSPATTESEPSPTDAPPAS